MNQVAVRRIEIPSTDYTAELQLRNQVLRIPIGLDIKDDDLTGEEQYAHFGAFADDLLVGTLYLKPLDDHTAQVKQVAVSQAVRRGGIGSKLMAAAEAQAELLGLSEIVLDARIDALAFYQTLGYQTTDDTHILLNIIHYHMKKTL